MTTTTTTTSTTTATRSGTPGPARGPAARSRHRAEAVRRFVGGFFLFTAGINAGMVAADPQAYRSFADGAYWSFVTDAWHDVVMARPTAWLLLLAAGELVLGLLLLRGGTPARVGWVGVLAFHVLLMAFGFGFWLWSLPALALLVPVAVRDWPLLAPPRTDVPLATPASRPPRPRTSTTRTSTTQAPTTQAPTAQAPTSQAPAGRRTPAGVTSTLVLAAAVVAAAAYGLLAQAPYRSLPEATVLGARAQDACSIVVAVLLVVLAVRRAPSVRVELGRLGLLAYLVYSYLIYVTGVPMNRMFLVYVVIVALAGAGLVAGLGRVVARPPASTAGPRLRRGTGWVLVVTAVLFTSLWLSTLLPFALGGARPDPEGAGGTPYPVFWLDLAIVLPAIAAVSLLLLRGRDTGPPLAVVALIKIVTLFTALWAGPLLALVTDEPVALGPDAGPSLLLLATSTALVVLWLRSFPAVEPRSSAGLPDDRVRARG